MTKTPRSTTMFTTMPSFLKPCEDLFRQPLSSPNLSARLSTLRRRRFRSLPTRPAPLVQHPHTVRSRDTALREQRKRVFPSLRTCRPADHLHQLAVHFVFCPLLLPVGQMSPPACSSWASRTLRWMWESSGVWQGESGMFLKASGCLRTGTMLTTGSLRMWLGK